jgi:hypothetical protein
MKVVNKLHVCLGVQPAHPGPEGGNGGCHQFSRDHQERDNLFQNQVGFYGFYVIKDTLG